MKENVVDVDRMYSTAVVGGGLAGLTVAYRLADSRAIVLEREERVGGRLQSLEMGDHIYNRGAQVIIGKKSLVGDLARELGLSLRAVPKNVRVLHMRGHYVRARSDPGFLVRVPLSMGEKAELVRKVLSIRRRYDFLAGHAVDVHDSRLAELDRTSFVEFIHTKSPGLRSLWDALSLNTTSVPATEVAALHPVRGMLDFMTPEWHVAGGTARITGELARRCVCPIEVGSQVLNVEDLSDAVRIDYLQGGVRRQLFSRKCVLAVPSPIVLAIAPGLPKWKHAALGKIDFASDTSAAFLLDKPAEAYLGRSIWRIPVVGASIIGVVNPGVSLTDEERSTRRGGLLRVYLGNPASVDMLDLSDEMALERLYTQLCELFPAIRGSVKERALTRWQYADSPWRPGRSAIVDDLAAAAGRIYFCGDFVDPAGMEGAVRSALKVVEVLGEATSRQAASFPASRQIGG